MDDSILYVFLGIVGGLVLFLVLRELVCWYYKSNKMVDLLEEISTKLGRLGDRRPSEEPPLRTKLGIVEEPRLSADARPPYKPSAYDHKESTARAKYFGAVASDLYHLPECPAVRTIASGAKKGFDTNTAAEEAGYSPCKVSGSGPRT